MAVGLDITNKKFGYLTAIKLIPYEKRKNNYHRREWLCKCDCGNEVVVEQRFLTHTGKQHIDSCGCIRLRAHLIATSQCKWLTLDYLLQFKDWDKFAFLHKQLVKIGKLREIDKEFYYNYINRFYYEEQFNFIYDRWQTSIKEYGTFYDWLKPSIDHIVPKSRGGSNELDNLQFLTIFENLCKRDMTQDEWIEFRKKSKTSSELFVGGEF